MLTGNGAFDNIARDDRTQLIGFGLLDSPDGASSGSINRVQQSEVAPLQLEGQPSGSTSRFASCHPSAAPDGLKRILIGSIAFAASITLALVLTIFLAPPAMARHAGVASDSTVCSQLGTKLLERGGSAVDAAIGTLLCVGFVNPLHSGIGGGGVMIVRDQKKNSSVVIDFTDVSPSGAIPVTQNASFNLSTAGATVAVPGMLRGLETAHTKFGKLSWKDVLQSVISFAQAGLNVSTQLDTEIKGLPSSSPLAQYFSKIRYGPAGSQLNMANLTAVLQGVASQGANAFYTGQVANDIVSAVYIGGTIVKASGGNISLADLSQYRANSDTSSIQTTFLNMNVETVSAPGGGPILLLLLNILENATLRDNIAWNSPQLAQYLIESMKFAFGHQEELGDPKFVESVTSHVSDMISKWFAEELAAQLEANTTHSDPTYYSHSAMTGAVPGGTSHVSVIGPNDDIVVVTASLNGDYGSGLVTSSGIILNSDMTNFDQNSVTNRMQPGGKRPLSALTPTIVYDPTRSCGLRLALGAAHGNAAIAGLAQVIVNTVAIHMNLSAAINSPRIFNPLFPNEVQHDLNVPPSVLSALEASGQNIVNTPVPGDTVHAVAKINQTVYGYTDYRTGGSDAVSVYK